VDTLFCQVFGARVYGGCQLGAFGTVEAALKENKSVWNLHVNRVSDSTVGALVLNEMMSKLYIYTPSEERVPVPREAGEARVVERLSIVDILKASVLTKIRVDGYVSSETRAAVKGTMQMNEYVTHLSHSTRERKTCSALRRRRRKRRATITDCAGVWPLSRVR
jgi:hypothetical protein